MSLIFWIVKFLMNFGDLSTFQMCNFLGQELEAPKEIRKNAF